jgi:hypothetical protein
VCVVVDPCLFFKLGGGVSFHSLSVFLNHSLPSVSPLDPRSSIIRIVVVVFVFPTQIMGLCGLLSNKGADAGYYPPFHFNIHLILVHRKIVILGDGACGLPPFLQYPLMNRKNKFIECFYKRILSRSIRTNSI